MYHNFAKIRKFLRVTVCLISLYAIQINCILAQVTYTITATTSTGGAITPSGDVTVFEGENQTFYFEPYECYEIDEVLIDGISDPDAVENGSYTFESVTEVHTIFVTFQNNTTYTITASSNANGTITPNEISTVMCGDNLTFIFTPNFCYHIAEVWIDNVSNTDAVTNGYFIFENITNDHTISVIFALNDPLIITSTTGAHGSIGPAGAIPVNCGESQTFTFTPDNCYAISQVLIDGSNNPYAAATGSYTFENVTIGHTISVTFQNNTTYTITASAGANGTITPSGIVSVSCGDNQTFTFTPDPGFEIALVVVDGYSNLNAVLTGSYTFTNVSGNHTISVTFKPETFSITVSPNLIAGGIVSGIGYNLEYGMEWTVRAIPLQSYVFVNWTENGVPVSDTAIYTFEITGSRVLVANFKLKSYSVTLIPNPTSGGTALGGGNSIEHGTYLEVVATPFPQYTFVDWTENDEFLNSDSAFTFRVTSSRILTANFTPKTYNITVSIAPDGGGFAYGGGYNLPFGTDTMVWATPNMNWVFDKWTENGVEVTNASVLPITVTGTRHLVANFKLKKFNVTVAANTAAGGIVSGGGNNIPYGNETTVRVDAISSNYKFVDWTENGVHASDSMIYTFTVTRSRHLVANFTLQTYDIIVEAEPQQGGNVFGGGYGIVYGTDTSVTAVANPHFNFWKWTEEGVTVCSDSYFPFSASHSCTLVAHFTAETYLINLSASPSTAGSVSGGGTYTYGTPITVSATPDSCHYFVNWTENGDTVSTTPDYSFEVEEPRNLVANFAPLIYNVTAIANISSGGTFTGTGLNIPCGTEITVCATPNVGYIFDYWIENGITIAYDSCITFTVLEDHNLTAHFTFLTYTIELRKDPLPGGQVWGDGIFPADSTITVHAQANPGFAFQKWTEFGQTVSLDAAYTFQVTQSRILTAHFITPTYHIDLAVNPSGVGGSANVVGGSSTNIPYEAWRTIKATPAAHFVFVNWTENGVHFSSNAVDSFPVIRNYNLVANFRLETCNINLSRTPEEGGYTTGAASNIPYGTPITVRAHNNLNYYFVKWTEDGITVNTQADWDFTVLGSRDLVAHFARKNFTITLWEDTPDGGSTAGGGTFPADTIITVTATVKPNYVFAGWFEYGVRVWDSAVYTFPVTRNRDLYAKFELAKYNILVSPSPIQGGNVDGGGIFTYGDTITVWASSKEFFKFVNWTEEGKPVSVDSNYKFSVVKNRDLVANFTSVQHLVTLKANPHEGGDVEGGGSYFHNSDIIVHAISKVGYVFVNWTENDQEVSQNADLPLTITQPRTLVANFVRKDVDVTTEAYPIEGGTTSGGGLNIPIGQEVTVVAKPNPEYRFVYWTKEEQVVHPEEEYSFFAMESCHLVAHFTKIEYTITLSANPSEWGTVYGGGIFPYGDTITVHATPNPTYSFLNWTENDVVVSTAADYKFMVTGAKELQANFEVRKYIVQVTSNDTLYGVVTGGGKYNLYDTVRIRAFPNYGYLFVNWTRDSAFVTTATSYTFVVTEDMDFVANFYGLDFDTYAATLWDNTFMLNLNKLARDGYDIIGCKWFKNGKEELITNTIDEFSYSAGPNKNNLLELTPTYYTYHLVLKDGSILFSTKKTLTKYTLEHAPPVPSKLFIYPNPVVSGNAFTIEGVTKDASLQVFSQNGVCLRTLAVNDDTIEITLNLPAGIYIIRNGHKEGKITIVK